MDDLERSLFKSLSRYQDNLLEEGKEFVRNWLAEQDDFEAAVDFLFIDGGPELLERYQGRFSFDIVAYAIESFHNSFEDEEDSGEDQDDDDDQEEVDEDEAPDRSEFYERVSQYFGC